MIDIAPRTAARPSHVGPVQWQQAIGLARQSCARIHRDGGTAREAALSFGIGRRPIGERDWERAVEAIALKLCASTR